MALENQSGVQESGRSSIFQVKNMDLTTEIREAGTNPQKLEQLFQTASRDGRSDEFHSALLARHTESPDNLLYSAWFYRLQQVNGGPTTSRRGVNWTTAVPLSLLTALVFWLLSDFNLWFLADETPQLVLWWAPAAAIGALAFLTLTVKTNAKRAAALGAGLLAAAAYAMFLASTQATGWRQSQYIVLAAIHIPLLCWGGLGIWTLGLRSGAHDRFAFLIKSIEVMITAGLYLIAGMAFGGITIGMFEALSINLPDLWMRLIIAGGVGLLPILAVASVYDPHAPPSEQDFTQGLSQFIATMMRLLLPLTLAVLVIYLFVIPFRFLEPFENRDVLIVFNLMLFAIMGLLLGATPSPGADLSPELHRWLRNGILAVAILAGLVNLYAFSAVVYRTIDGGLTINRLVIIGWNAINIGILAALIFKQYKAGREKWVEALQATFSLATNAYFAWGMVLLILVPLIF